MQYPLIRLGGAGDRFGDYFCADCTNLSCVSGRNQFTDTKLTRPITKISRSTTCRRGSLLKPSRFGDSFALRILQSIHPSIGGKQKLFVRRFVKGYSDESNEALIPFLLHAASSFEEVRLRVEHIFAI